MSVKPWTDDWLRIEGDFSFTAETPVRNRITDTYRVEISIPLQFPNDLPLVKETGGRIPKTPDFHVNPDGTLCLGSPLRLMLLLQQDPTITSFTKNCLVPFLCAASAGSLTGQVGMSGGLAHGNVGLVEDYKDLFGLNNSEQVHLALKCLLRKRRTANKLPCPCGCGQRLGRCQFNEKIRAFRDAIPRKWLRQNLSAQ